MISRPGESGFAASLPARRSVPGGRASACRGPRTTDARAPRPLRRFDECSDTVARDRLRHAAPRRESPRPSLSAWCGRADRLWSQGPWPAERHLEFARRRQLTTRQSPTLRRRIRVVAAMLRFRSCRSLQSRPCEPCAAQRDRISHRTDAFAVRRPRHPGACPTCRTALPWPHGIARSAKRLSPQRFTCDWAGASRHGNATARGLAAVEGDHADANDFDSCNPALCRHRRTGGRPDDFTPGQARASGGASHRSSGRHHVEVQLRRRLGHLRVCELPVRQPERTGRRGQPERPVVRGLRQAGAVRHLHDRIVGRDLRQGERRRRAHLRIGAGGFRERHLIVRP